MEKILPRPRRLFLWKDPGR